VSHDIQSRADRFANRADWFYLEGLSSDLMAQEPRHPEVGLLLQPKSVSTHGKWMRGASCGMVQKQVTREAWLGSTPGGPRPQIRGFRAGGLLAVASSTPATRLLSPAKMLTLNHALDYYSRTE